MFYTTNVEPDTDSAF